MVSRWHGASFSIRPAGRPLGVPKCADQRGRLRNHARASAHLARSPRRSRAERQRSRKAKPAARMRQVRRFSFCCSAAPFVLFPIRFVSFFTTTQWNQLRDLARFLHVTGQLDPRPKSLRRPEGGANRVISIGSCSSFFF